MIDAARTNPRLRNELETGIVKFQQLRINANEKIGREASLAARKRLSQRRSEFQHSTRANIDLLYDDKQNLARAERVISLMRMRPTRAYPVF